MFLCVGVFSLMYVNSHSTVTVISSVTSLPLAPSAAHTTLSLPLRIAAAFSDIRAVFRNPPPRLHMFFTVMSGNQIQNVGL